MIPEAVKNILIRLEENGYEAYLVGGFVRDSLLKRETNDFDLATNALPKNLVEIFGQSKRKIEYGSYNLKINNYNIDITTYRKEGEYNNRKPINLEYTNNLIFDAERRDFTINALYMNKLGEIIDPLGVKEDITKKILKTIGNPSIRFKEDPLRILRAVRFASIYKLKMEKEMVNSIKKSKKLLTTLSKDRIKKELDGILLVDGFSLLKKLDLLQTLGIETKKVVYVNDLAGLWAQLETTIEYPKEKNFQKREKIIKNQIKYGTIDMLFLYKNGYYESLVVSEILHFPKKKLEKLEQNLSIKTRKDICISIQEVEEKYNIHGAKLGQIYQELEEKIVFQKIKNERESIEKFLKEESSCQTSNF